MSEYEGWAILELMGHRQRPGYVKEVEIAGAKMLRIDIPVAKDMADQDIRVTEFYGASAVYSLRPCAEDVARAVAAQYGADPRPVRPMEFRDRPAAKALTRDAEEDDERPF